MNNLAELLESVPFREQWRRMLVGLHAPRGSGEHAYAVYLLKHFFGPSIMSMAGSFLILMVVLCFKVGLDDRPCVLGDLTDIIVLDPAKEKIESDSPPEKEQTVQPPPTPVESEKEIKPEWNSTVPENQEPSVGPPNPFLQEQGAGGSPDGVKDSIEEKVIDMRPFTGKSVAIIKDLSGRTDGEREIAFNKYGPGGPGGGSNNAWTVTEGTVVRALWWLKKEQQPDGSWNSTKPAMTGLALLTYLAHGDTSSSKKFGPTVEKGVKWLLTNQESDGHFKGRDPHDYSHPIATYALCEAYGMMPLPDIKAAAEKAVDVIIKGQNASGGWDYNCKPGNRDDVSYMGWCIQALKAADIAQLKNEGLKPAMKKAVLALKRSANSAGRFGYTGPNDGTGGLTGVGVLCMQMLGAGRQPEALNGIVWLQQATCDWEKPWLSSPIYYWYYVTQAKFHAGGTIWENWDKQFSLQLIKNQKSTKKAVEGPDGKMHDIGWWEPPAGVKGHTDGPVMDTCLCALQLEVYYRHLPTYDVQKDIQLEGNFSDPADLQIQVSSLKNK